MNGLEAAEVRYSQVSGFSTFRVDAEFYKKLYLQEDERRGLFDNICIAECAFVTDGQHGYHEVDSNSSIAHLTAKNARGWFASRVNAEPLAKWVDDVNKRSSLKANDVLLSTRGTVGLCAVVKKEVLPANIDQDIARIALTEKSPLLPEYLVVYLNSCFGQDWITRNATGMVQQGLSLESVRQIPVPSLSTSFQQSVSQLVQRAHSLLQDSKDANKAASEILLSDIDMVGFENEENCNSVSFSSSFVASGRLDAEFYQPKYDELFERIHANAEYVKPMSGLETFNSRGLQPVYEERGTLAVINSRHILEDGLDYDNFEKTGDGFWETREKARVKRNDILVYTTGANIGRSQPYLSDEPALASNHVNILRIQDEDPLYVAFVMNSLIGRMQTERLSAGTAQAELYPKDISQFVIPFVSKEKQREIVDLIMEAREKKAESFQCLEKAKRAVEIAIEKGEEAAMAYLEGRSFVAQTISQDLAQKAPYFSIDAVRDWLAEQKMSYKPDTVKSYLSRQKKEGKIFDAGRGWYSSLPEVYRLDIAPVEKLVAELEQAFPLLDFACWSTAQLNEMLRHQLAKHVRFVYVERDAINSVADWLRDNGYRPWVNPGKKERQSFVVEENCVVVFPLTSKSPCKNGFASIGKILVDVLADTPDFSIINIPEFIEGAQSVISSERIDISELMSYATRRGSDLSGVEKGTVIH